MKHITDENFEEVESYKGPYMVEFFATWCPHCQRMAPIIEQVAKEYDGKVEVFLVDVDQSADANQKYEVSGTPTLFFYKKDNELSEKIVGEQPIEVLRKTLDKLI